MKNIEKYEDEIRSELKVGMSIGCATKKSRETDCGDEFDCHNCCIRAFNWLLEEYKEPIKPILTEKEKIIIKNILKAFEPFGKELSYIAKERWDYGKNCCFLDFKYGYDNFGTLTFNQDKLFKGMEINKCYTLEGLGL